MTEWGPGLTDSQLEEAEERYGVRFPPDMIELYREQWPIEAYDWSKEDPRIREMLAWPLDMLTWHVEHGSWWTEWGEKPTDQRAREKIVRDAVAAAPRLIPIYLHRFIPESPNEPGNPVFSMHGFDTIYYGTTLEEYLAREFRDDRSRPPDPLRGPFRYIPLWSDLSAQDERSIWSES